MVERVLVWIQKPEKCRRGAKEKMLNEEGYGRSWKSESESEETMVGGRRGCLELYMNILLHKWKEKRIEHGCKEYDERRVNMVGGWKCCEPWK